MNILQVCAYAAPYEGNFMKSLYALDQQLTKQGHRVIYAFCQYAKEVEWIRKLKKRRKVYFLPQRYARINPSTYFKLRRILVKEQIKIVHSHFELYDLPLSIVSPKSCQIIWHLHDTLEDNYYKENKLRKRLYQLQYKSFSKRAILCSVSEKHMRFAISLGFDSKNALFVPNGVDFSRLHESNTSKCEYDFLIFAWDYLRKGADIAIKAAKQLYEESYRFKIGFVGNETLWDNEEIQSVMQEPWFVKQNFEEDISDLYNSTKCFLHLSRSEGCSYALIEASYFGLPIISSDIDENMFLNHLPTIKMIRSESIIDTFNAMKNIIEQDFLLDVSDVLDTKNTIRKYYSLDAWVKNILSVYRSYCGLK